MRKESFMKSLLSLGVVAIILLGAAGCETPMTAVIALDNGGDLTSATTKMSLKGGGDIPSAKTIKVTEKGTYYLYSSKDPKTPIFEKELKKGDELGFSVHGDRAHALAAGTIVELSDYAEGASYVWKIEEKKKE
jgi:hypothetical protein